MIINNQLVKLPGPLGRLKGLYLLPIQKKTGLEIFPGIAFIPNGDTINFISVYKIATGPL